MTNKLLTISNLLVIKDQMMKNRNSLLLTTVFTLLAAIPSSTAFAAQATKATTTSNADQR